MRLSPIIPFGSWEPDAPPLGSKLATEIINAVPVDGAYGPVKELLVSGPIGPGRPLAGIGGNASFVAYPSGLYRNGARADASESVRWGFENWGDLTVIANGVDLAYYDGTARTAIPGIKCGLVSRVKDFLVAADLTGSPSFIRWSAFNDITDWKPSKKTQADLNDMGAEFGAVMGVIGNENPFILQERSISRMTYAGPPVIFGFVRLSDHKGCISKGSVIDTPFGSGFFSQDGPNIVQGDSIKQIAKGRFHKWFATNFNPAWPVSAGFDWETKTIRWSWFDGAKHSGLVYSTIDDRATLTTDGPALYLNSAGNVLVGYDATGRAGTFTGENAKATLVTGEVQIEPQRRSFVSEIWPVVDSQVKYASAGVRADLATQTVVYTPEVQANEDGMSPCRSSARAHRFKIVIPRGQAWRHAQGVQAGFRPEGRR